MEIFNPARWVMCSIVLLGGCVHYVPKPIAPADALGHFEQRSLDAPGLHEFLRQALPGDKTDSWPMQAWDADMLALAALYYRPDMELVRARWVAARSALVSAGQRPNPVLGFAPQYNTSSSGISPWILPLTLDVPMETHGVRSARQRQADASRARFAC